MRVPAPPPIFRVRVWRGWWRPYLDPWVVGSVAALVLVAALDTSRPPVVLVWTVPVVVLLVRLPGSGHLTALGLVVAFFAVPLGFDLPIGGRGWVWGPPAEREAYFATEQLSAAVGLTAGQVLTELLGRAKIAREQHLRRRRPTEDPDGIRWD